MQMKIDVVLSSVESKCYILCVLETGYDSVTSLKVREQKNSIEIELLNHKETLNIFDMHTHTIQT